LIEVKKWTASLTNLKVDITQGMADIEAGRVDDLNMERIKQQGRAILAKRKQQSE